MPDTPHPTPGDRPASSPTSSAAAPPTAIDFYAQAFGAEEQLRLPGPDGKLVHAA